jgi:hypothetical protein
MHVGTVLVNEQVWKSLFEITKATSYYVGVEFFTMVSKRRGGEVLAGLEGPKHLMTMQCNSAIMESYCLHAAQLPSSNALDT